MRSWFVPLVALAIMGISRVTGAAEPVAVTESQLPGIRAEIIALKRSSGDTLTLKFRIVNESDKSMDPSCKMRETATEPCGPISGVHILDTVGGKKYLVLRDSTGRCICADVGTIGPGKSLLLWAKFPAPPAETRTVSVIIPLFLPADDVPIAE